MELAPDFLSTSKEGRNISLVVCVVCGSKVWVLQGVALPVVLNSASALMVVLNSSCAYHKTTGVAKRFKQGVDQSDEAFSFLWCTELLLTIE